MNNVDLTYVSVLDFYAKVSLVNVYGQDKVCGETV